MTNNELNFLKIFDFSNKYKTIDSRLNTWKTFHKRYVYILYMYNVVACPIDHYATPGSKLLSFINFATCFFLTSLPLFKKVYLLFTA